MSKNAFQPVALTDTACRNIRPEVGGFAVHLRVLHHTVNAVEVAHVIHCLSWVLQHAPHRLHTHTQTTVWGGGKPYTMVHA